MFHEKELQKKKKKNQQKNRKLMKIKWKGYDNSFNSWVGKKKEISEYFSKPKSLMGKVKVKLDLSNYATKADLKNATDVDQHQNLLKSLI